MGKMRTNGVIRVADEALKRRIVEEIESGEMSQSEAARAYGFNRSAFSKWLRQYGRLPHRREIVEVVMKDEKERLSELQSALSDAHLKIRLYEKMFELAKSEYQIDLKKNYSTQASELLKKKGPKLPESAE
jgi:transposase